MLRLIKPDLASTGKPHLRNGTPSCFLNLRACNARLREGSHLGFQAVAQEIEFVGTIHIGWVERGFCWRQGENQPTMTCIHGFKPEDVAEECAVRLDVFTATDHVSAKNHLPSKAMSGLIIHRALTSISFATSVSERFSLVMVKSSNRARSRMTFNFATRATYFRCDTPASRTLMRCCIASTLAVRRQMTVCLAETTLRHSSSSARSSIARASKSRLTPSEA